MTKVPRSTLRNTAETNIDQSIRRAYGMWVWRRSVARIPGPDFTPADRQPLQSREPGCEGAGRASHLSNGGGNGLLRTRASGDIGAYA